MGAFRWRLLPLQFICLVCQSPPQFSVECLLIGRQNPRVVGVMDGGQLTQTRELSDALEAIQRLAQPEPGPRYYGNNEDYLQTPYDARDLAVAREVLKAMGQNVDYGDGEPYESGVFGSFNQPYYDEEEDLTGGDFEVTGDENSDSEPLGSGGKTELKREEVEELFGEDKTGSDAGVDGIRDDGEVSKKTELSRNDVEKLFQDAESEGDSVSESEGDDAGGKNSEETGEVDVVTPAGEMTSDKVLTVVGGQGEPEVVKAVGVVGVEENEKGGEGADGGKEKLTKEWMFEVVQPEKDEDSRTLWSGGKKFKRSMSTEEEQEEFEATARQRAVELLKTYIELQDDENKHLTEALNLATLSQAQRTDRYIGEQLEHLKEAVQDEDAIEDVRRLMKSDEEQEGQENQQEEEEEDFIDNEPFEQLLENPEPQDDDDEVVSLKRENAENSRGLLEEVPYEDDEDISEYERNAFLREKLRQYLLSKEREQDAVSDVASWMGGLHRPPSLIPPDNIYSDSRLNPFTRELEDLYRYPPPHRGLIKRFDSSDEIALCPAVVELTDNCLVAREHSLRLDDEAMELCNRHQLCYICGSTLGLPAENCDRGYLGEAELLCSVDGDSPGQCMGEAAGLFAIMLRGHSYTVIQEYAPPICQESCAYEYIVAGGKVVERRK